MAIIDNFNAHEVEPAGDFNPVPNGKYAAMIIESDMKATKNRTGSYLELEFIISDGQYKGRKIWARLNINNPSSEAQRIAKGYLSAICRAVQVMTPQDSRELHNIPLIINVVCKERGDGKGITNEIASYEDISGQQINNTTASQQSSPQATASNTPPTNANQSTQNTAAPWTR